jgi:hypothetical protein
VNIRALSSVAPAKTQAISAASLIYILDFLGRVSLVTVMQASESRI